jgi:beta-glucanase (GH16 family)
MKQVISLLSLLCLLGIANAGWQQTFAEEFNSQTKLNTTTWNVFYSYSPSIINQELQWYYPGAFNFTASTLQIIASQKYFNTSVGWRNYTSGAMTTLHKWSQVILNGNLSKKKEIRLL